MGRGIIDVIQANLSLPCGEAGLWKLILKLDQAGPWSAWDVAQNTNLNRGRISSFVKKLRLGGYLNEAGTRPGWRGGTPAKLYRLAKRPIDTPRLTKDGSEKPELTIDVLWRTMKMAKLFTVRDLVDLAAREDCTITVPSAWSYCNHLARAGVLARVAGKERETRFRLVANLGPHAPKILGVKGKIVFDPNARKVLGAPELFEAGA